MLENNPWGITKKNFEYLFKLLVDKKISLGIAENSDGCAPGYIHKTIILRAKNKIRKIIHPTMIRVYSADNILIDNPELIFEEQLNEGCLCFYKLACLVYLACCFWPDFCNEDIDVWSERRFNKYGKDKEFYRDIFNYNADICQSLIDIFGQKETEDLIEEFIPKCKNCSSKMVRKDS